MKKTFLSLVMGLVLLSGISITAFDHMGMTSFDHIGWGG